MSEQTVPRENSSSSNGGGAPSRDRERDGGLVGSAYSAPLFLSLSSRERERDTRSGAGSGSVTGTGNNVGSVAYSSHAHTHAASSASYCDDDRSDAATIGTSVADWDGPLGHIQSSNSMQAGGGAADDHRFDAVKRWALRVNNSATLTDHAADNGVSDLLDDLVLVDPTLVSSPALSAANIQTPHLPLPLPLPLPVSSTSRTSRTLPVPNISALASSPVPSPARLSNARRSSNVDPNFLDEFIASLEKSDAEAVCNFIASYRGPDVVSAMYAHLAKIEDLRAAERITEEMPAKPLEWESLPLESNDDDDDDVSRVAVPQDGVNRGIGSVAAMGSSGNRVGETFAFTNSTEDGLFSDEADVWDQTEGGQSAAESDWIVLDDQLASGGIQPLSTTLEHLPKNALTKILIYSHNSNLLKASRRLARLPIPTLGQELAEVILSLIPNASRRHGHSSAGSNASSRKVSDESVKPSAHGADVSLHPTYAPSLNEILTRAARCPYANRSHLTLPCLARLSSSGATAATPLLRRDSNASDAVTNGIDRVTVETLGAVIDIAAKERRWNSVRGAIMLAKMRFAGVGANVIVSVEDIEEQSMRRPGVVFASLSGPLANNAPGVGSAAAAAGSAGPLMEVNGSISTGQGVASEGLVPLAGSRVYAGLVANIVANHGKGLNVAFFKDLVEDGGVVFGVDVIRHCSEHYGISAAVTEYLLEENEKVTGREVTTPQVHFGTSPGLLS